MGCAWGQKELYSNCYVAKLQAPSPPNVTKRKPPPPQITLGNMWTTPLHLGSFRVGNRDLMNFGAECLLPQFIVNCKL